MIEVTDPTAVCQDIVATVAASLRPLADEKQLRFRVDMPAEPVTLTSDARALTQILTNLVGNAIKSTDAGELVIRMSRAASDVGLGDDPTAHRGAHTQSLIISVHDTGIGITPADQARLFQEFGRVDSAEVRARGHGIGATTCAPARRAAGRAHSGCQRVSRREHLYTDSARHMSRCAATRQPLCRFVVQWLDFAPMPQSG